jgi:hypothetical protein
MMLLADRAALNVEETWLMDTPVTVAAEAQPYEISSGIRIVPINGVGRCAFIVIVAGKLLFMVAAEAVGMA